MHSTHLSQKQRFGTGFLAGLAAGIVATGLMVLLNVTVGGISLPQVFSSTLTALIPPSGFDFLLSTIGSNAKHYLFFAIVVGQCLVFALSGGLCNLIIGAQQAKHLDSTDPEELPWTSGLLLALILWLATGLLFLPLTGGGVFGAVLAVGVINTMLSLAAAGLTFGLLFVYVQNLLAIRSLRKQGVEVKEGETGWARRVILQRGLSLLGLGVVGVLAWNFINGSKGGFSQNVSVNKLSQDYKSKITPPPQPNYDAHFQSVPQLSTEITPNSQYYVVSKNLFSDPNVNSAQWHLTVDGLVEKPYTLSYQELMALPMKQQYESMMCISNEVGGDYMSNTVWEGIQLKDLLARAGAVKTGATKVVLYAADDYSDSIHLSKALAPTTLMAVRMGGKTLPQGHGYPARLLVPGIYGMKHVKWITHIQVVDTDFQGYWQQRGWSDSAPINLTSRIDTPLVGTTLPAHKATYIAGVAFSGDKGISEVDVSTNAGQSWQKAALKQPLSALTWVLWELPWQPAAGSYTIVVRAIDMEGNVQLPDIAPPLPNGSTGYHSIDVSAS